MQWVLLYRHIISLLEAKLCFKLTVRCVILVEYKMGILS
uniref:Uncharacterized protein n=1 Tax=Rhizophora mucronata TaxID=61149 RepID=A0A2P2QC32_RHIMU